MKGDLTCSSKGAGALGYIPWALGLALAPSSFSSPTPKDDTYPVAVMWLEAAELGGDCWNVPSLAITDMHLVSKSLSSKSLRGPRVRLDYYEGSGVLSPDSVLRAERQAAPTCCTVPSALPVPSYWTLTPSPFIVGVVGESPWQGREPRFDLHSRSDLRSPREGVWLTHSHTAADWPS